jgi:small basic protein (TIGR04137 family)
MSLDKSLRSRGALARHRNVLSRAERVDMLKEEGKWEEGKTVFGLPKVAHRKVTTKKVKAVVAAAEGAVGAEGAAAPAAAPAAAAAPAKGAKPAKGGK